MKIPETSANVGAYYGNEENGQWQVCTRYLTLTIKNTVYLSTHEKRATHLKIHVEASKKFPLKNHKAGGTFARRKVFP